MPTTAKQETGWQYFRKRLRDSLEFKWWQDAVVATVAVIIGYLVLERKAAWENFVSVVIIGLGATIVFEALKTAYRFVWTVPRQDHMKLEQVLDKLRPKFKVEKIVAQRTETNTQGTVEIYLQVIPECLGDVPLEECQGWLLLVSRADPRNEQWVPTEMNSPLKLGWDYYGHDPIAIHPGIPQRLCICRWNNRATAIIPTVKPLPAKWMSIIGPGPFKFDIRINAIDCSPVDVSVTVNLLGQAWDRPQYELIQGHHNA